MAAADSFIPPEGENPILALLKYYGKNDGWFNGQRSIIPNFDDYYVFWLTGERRIGKTDLMLRLACDLFIHYNLQTMWVRNKQVELRDPSFHADFLNDAKKHEWAPEEWICNEQGVFESKDKEAKQIIKFQSISTFSNRRGGAHPRVIMIVFDEFMPEDRKYPPMAAQGIMSLTKTVFSGRTDARLFCLSNFTSAANPYFVKFRIYPSTELVTLYPEKRMLIERCDGYRKAIDKGNPWNDVYEAGGMGNYASEKEDDLIGLIVPKVPKGAKPYSHIYYIEGQYYRAYYNNQMTIYTEYKGSRKGLMAFTPNTRECSDNCMLIMQWMIKRIVEDLQTGVIRFTNPNVMFAILNMAFDKV